jgi:hypothetical protein
MELRIRIRQTQYYAIETVAGGLTSGDPIIYAGSSPMNLIPVLGTVPAGDTWLDITSDVTNLDELELEWTTDRDTDGNVVAGAFQPKKTASGQLLIEGNGYAFIKDWLIDNVAAPRNSIDVQIEHVGCGTYDMWVIKSSQIRWCENDICEFSVNLQQTDEAFQCMQKTLISDNWQGWFQTQPTNGKKHPRFVYCNEVKPNGMMVMLWWLSSVILTIVILLYMGILPIIWAVQLIIGVVKTIVDVFSWILGIEVDFSDNFDFTDPRDFLNSLGSFYVESSGCGRLHPAPLVRDYIDNVCKKCGIRVDAITDPIFHARQIMIDTSSEREDGMKLRDNPHFNAAYFNAPIQRGIRIFRGLFSNDENTTDYFIERNKPILALDQFLDQLKTLYNAEWRLTSIGGQPTLYFWRKDWYLLGSALYDFTEDGEDRDKVLDGICFNWLEKPQFAYMRGVYSEDASDTCGNESLGHMNDIISLGDATNNPTYAGQLDKTSFYFGGTRFRLDGTSNDYIADAMQVVLNGAALNPTIPAIMKEIVVPSIERYADYALLMSDETAVLPKLIIWDENSGFEHAKAIRNKNTFPTNGSGLSMPIPNSFYNPNNLEWYMFYQLNTYVMGSVFTFGSAPYGRYTVQEYFGIDFYAKPAELCNYPMYFNSKFKDTLFDWFHWIDDPRINPRMNMEFTVNIDLCCEDLQRLKVFGDAANINLFQKVLLPVKWYNEGTITSIRVVYNSENELGKHIQIKGVL